MRSRPQSLEQKQNKKKKRKSVTNVFMKPGWFVELGRIMLSCLVGCSQYPSAALAGKPEIMGEMGETAAGSWKEPEPVEEDRAAERQRACAS